MLGMCKFLHLELLLRFWIGLLFASVDKSTVDEGVLLVEVSDWPLFRDLTWRNRLV